MSDSDSLDLIDGFAAILVANVPGAAYHLDTPYVAGELGIFNMLLPASPDECITLTWVPQSENPADPSGTGLLQVRARGAANKPRRPVEILDQVGSAFLGATHIPIGDSGLEIIQVTSRVRVPMGMDDSKRWDWSDNYTLDVYYTPTLLRPAAGWD